MTITFKTLANGGIALALIGFLGLTGCSSVTCNKCLPITVNIKKFPPINALLLNTSETTHSRHIYLEGDGIPWKRGIYPSDNPTSKQALSLRLMQQDTNDSIYLHRPCYGFEKKPPAPCINKWWTNARYSEEIVNAMNEALDSLQQNLGKKPLVLIGFSGGGTLAMLLANKRNDVTGVITLAGNLDPDAWTQFHNYLPLDESLNPSKEPVLSPSIFRWHFVGNKDNNITPSSVTTATANDPLAKIIETPNTHNCCWAQQWPKVLESLTAVEAAP